MLGLAWWVLRYSSRFWRFVGGGVAEEMEAMLAEECSKGSNKEHRCIVSEDVGGIEEL